ncbi:MAG: tRNA lysidine(34) synthetase [Halanaerobium sp.]
MNFSLDKKITAKVIKAAAEFEMINNDDRIAVGLSGGKDSLFLSFILKLLQLYSKKEFYLTAVHVDPGFPTEDKRKNLEIFTDELEIDLQIIKTNIAEYINGESNNPCSKCSHFRKGAIINYMKKNDLNKLALGHHLDDAVETFLMNIFYSGQLKALQPLRYLSKNKISIIRPLIYLRERTIKNEIKKKNINISKSSCPYDGDSARAEVRKKFAEYFKDDSLFANLISSMRKKENIELWPEESEYNFLQEKMDNFWK